MTPDDIHRELDKLWSKVTAGGTPPASPFTPPAYHAAEYSLYDSPAITREVTLETVSLIKKQHRDEVLRLSQLLELKERSVAELGERLRQASAELDRLRRREETVEALTTQATVSYAAELEAAEEAKRLAQERLKDEEARLRTIAEESRRRLNSEETRWKSLEADWTEREQDYLLRLRELEARAEKERERAASAQGVERRALSDLGEAKTAIESSLSQLLVERREREEAEKERGRALQRVKDVEERMNELQNLFAEERKQWQELWDRERSAWEGKKQELASWEDRVRQEKEAFHLKFGELEERETRHASEMSEILRRSSDAGEKMSDFMRQAAAKAAELAQLPASAPGAPRRWDWRVLAGAAAALVLAAAAVPVWRALHKLDFTLVSSHALEAARPTAIAFDGDALWVAEWDGGLAACDPGDPATVLRRTVVAAKGPYHPASLSVWAGKMYTLDAAQARILRHAIVEPERVEAAWPSPGPAPAALAHDGQNLWSYDAATKLLYRHLGEGAEAQVETYSVGFDAALTALRWHKDELWAWDAKGKQLVALRLKGKAFELEQAAPLVPGAQSFLFTYRAGEKNVQQLELWALSTDAAGQHVLNKYLVRR
ncbi:MAG: hypothetical protein HYZ75_11395 [Elusimicrobia bacterium]|nr:hypothetical protein [Elusimicrobiota bacterium]